MQTGCFHNDDDGEHNDGDDGDDEKPNSVQPHLKELMINPTVSRFSISIQFRVNMYSIKLPTNQFSNIIPINLYDWRGQRSDKGD